MPNHVANRLEIITDSTALYFKIREFIKLDREDSEDNKEKIISFTKWIPRYYELYRTPESVLGRPYEQIDAEERKAVLIRIENENFEKYGYLSWYEYNRDKYGTKWDAYEAYEEDGKIYYNTAWCTADKAILALSKEFPDASFHVTFADEDAGYNCGEYTCKNGEYTEYYEADGGTTEAMNYFFDLHPDEEDYYYQDENGEWKYMDE